MTAFCLYSCASAMNGALCSQDETKLHFLVERSLKENIEDDHDDE